MEEFFKILHAEMTMRMLVALFINAVLWFGCVIFFRTDSVILLTLLTTMFFCLIRGIIPVKKQTFR